MSTTAIAAVVFRKRNTVRGEIVNPLYSFTTGEYSSGTNW
jgi:hypothetical protein